MTSVVLPNTVNEISDNAFKNNAHLKAINLGNSVKSIGKNVFAGCDLLSVIFPNTLESIGDYAFSENSNLKTVSLNPGLLSIGDAAFANCSSIESISIPGTVTKIGNTVIGSDEKPTKLPFYNCTSIKTVRFEDGTKPIKLTSYCRYYKANYPNGERKWTYDTSRCYGLFTFCPLEEVYIGRDISYLRGNNITLDEHPDYYGYSAFYNQPKLAKVTISQSVTDIPSYLFYKNAAITLTELPNVKAIGHAAFQECSKLTTLNLGEDMQEVGNDAFNGCKNVTKLTFPDAITTIGDRAFQYCI